MEVKVFDITGKEVGSLPVELSGAISDKVFLQYLRSVRFAARKGQAATKTRGEVSGGGRKPWRQKGTGRARQGSIRSPIWKGGGVAHGPKVRSFRLDFNKKYMPQVWNYVLSQKLLGEGEWVVLKSEENSIKTKQAQQFLRKVNHKIGRVLVVSANSVIKRAFRNLKDVFLARVENLAPFEVTLAKKLVTDELTFGILKKKLSKG